VNRCITSDVYNSADKNIGYVRALSRLTAVLKRDISRHAIVSFELVFKKSWPITKGLGT